MARAEILSEIKQAEEEARKLVIRSDEARTQKISEARAHSKEIISKAEDDAAQMWSLEINRVKLELRKERETVIEKGIKEAEEIKARARKNISKANDFILNEFERAVNA